MYLIRVPLRLFSLGDYIRDNQPILYYSCVITKNISAVLSGLKRPSQSLKPVAALLKQVLHDYLAAIISRSRDSSEPEHLVASLRGLGSDANLLTLLAI